MALESILEGPILLLLAAFILPFISFVSGLYLSIIAIWELRIAEQKEKFISYMFLGIFLMFVAPFIIAIFILSFLP